MSQHSHLREETYRVSRAGLPNKEFNTPLNYNGRIWKRSVICTVRQRKFWVDVSRFSTYVINLSRMKNICCELKKQRNAARWLVDLLDVDAWQVVSLMKNEQQSQNLLLKVDLRSIFRDNLFMLRDMLITQGEKRVISTKNLQWNNVGL